MTVNSNVQIKNRKSALYIRVSTHYQIDRDSLPLQREDLISYSKYVLGIDKYEIFEDAGYSAKNTDRPAYQQMMSRLRTGEFSHLIVWKIDRISRNLLDFASMYDEIKKLGITFVSKNEQFDTSSAMGEAMLKIILVFAELERNMTSERVSAVMMSRASNGQWNGGKIPYGYDYDKKNQLFSVNEAESNIVKQIYKLYTENKSLMHTTKQLNERGITTKSGSSWSPATVSKIIKSRFYLGEYQYSLHKSNTGGAIGLSPPETDILTVQKHHPAIITASQWEECARIRSRNRNPSQTSGKDRHKYTHIFSGVLFCGECGSMYQSKIDKIRADGYRPSIYLCSRRKSFSDCGNKYMSDVTLGPFVLRYISNLLNVSQNLDNDISLKSLQKRLLCGNEFENVKGLSKPSIKKIHELLLCGSFSQTLFGTHSAQTDHLTVSQELMGGKYINFDSFIRHIDADVLKQFIQSVIEKITVLNGRVVSMYFKNGSEHKFLY